MNKRKIRNLFKTTQLTLMLFSVNQLVQAQSLVILGTIQDGGSPHIGCTRTCCTKKSDDKKVTSIGLIDPSVDKTWLIEATPDISEQLRQLQQLGKSNHPAGIDGIFLTHAHIGHYSGLLFLGKEALGTSELPVYGLPKMTGFLSSNGPWSQLVKQKNILLRTITETVPVELSKNLNITAFRVPHRDEFSETAGFLITGPTKKILFIPDIDKWEKWNVKIDSLFQAVDMALIDGTFFNNAEIGYRDISQIPHPLVAESIEKFQYLKISDRKKIFFIHLNHTNPLLRKSSQERKKLKKEGYNVAEFGMKFRL